MRSIVDNTSFPFSFSEYVINEAFGGSLNPLGLQSAYMALTNKLFPQFTTLSVYPRYFLLLCSILHHIHNEKNTHNIRKRFREYENLWGVGQAKLLQKKDGPSPLNIQKYESVRHAPFDGEIRFDEINSDKYHLFDRLNYGAYGHYVMPAISWGLVKKDRASLTPLGSALAEILIKKHGSIYKKWLPHSVIMSDSSDLLKFLEDSILSPAQNEISNEEKEVWKKIMEKQYTLLPYFKALWKKLSCSTVKGLLDSSINGNSKKYTAFFPSLKGLYEGEKDIIKYLEWYEIFEEFSSLIEFLFELQYYLLHKKASNLTDKNMLIDTKELCKEKLLVACEKMKTLPNDIIKLNKIGMDIDKISKEKTVEVIYDIIINRHKQIQHEKAKAPFYSSDGAILQYGQIEFNRIEGVLNAIERLKSDSIPTIRWFYRRDWHFLQAVRIKEIYNA